MYVGMKRNGKSGNGNFMENNMKAGNEKAKIKRENTKCNLSNDEILIYSLKNLILKLRSILGDIY